MRVLYILLSIFFFTSITVNAQSIEWLDLKEAQKKASKTNKKVLIFAEAEWCPYCKKMNEDVFTQQTVADSLQKYFYPVRIDIESESRVQFNGRSYSEKSLSRKFRAIRTPTTVFVDSEGNIIGIQPGYLSVEIFNNLLSFIGREFYGRISFKKYLNGHGVGVK